jgi:hypothetical protein
MIAIKESDLINKTENTYSFFYVQYLVTKMNDSQQYQELLIQTSCIVSLFIFFTLNID